MEGIDIFESNTGMPSWSDIFDNGFRYVFHKTNEFGPGHPHQTDARFAERWPELQNAGFIRGSFNLVHNNVGSPEDQARTAVSVLHRLVPGDLGPSLDMEDRDPAHTEALDPGFWVDFGHRYLDTIETALGRQPMIYTSRSYWQEFTGNSADLSDYPLWVIDINHADDAVIPPAWASWTFWQFHTELSPSPMPAPFKSSDKGVDLNHFNGAISQLRGMADLEHTAPHVIQSIVYIAYTDLSGHIHVMVSLLGKWEDTDVFNDLSDAPLAAGDPAAVGVGNEQIIVYRGKDGHIYALSRPGTDLTDHWSVQDITGAIAVDDPQVIVVGNNVHVVYRNESDSQSHMIRAGGVWSPERLSGTDASGSAAMLLYDGVVRAVSRGGADGHLHEYSRQNNTESDVDLSAQAHDAGGNAPPAATYRPSICYPREKAPRIVYRALHGEIWMIERDTLLATRVNVNGAPLAVGSPTAMVAETMHVIYRTATGDLIDIFEDSGSFHQQTIQCNIAAAADPTAFYDAARVAISFRAVDDLIHVARYVDGTWVCQTANP
jgi:GH25 family lysozyme M1 (1,4-beta-N-acetylmuramidase)